MKACLGTIFFIKKINESLKIPLIFEGNDTNHTKKIIESPFLRFYTTQFFCLHVKRFTILLPFAFILFDILIEPYTSF